MKFATVKRSEKSLFAVYSTQFALTGSEKSRLDLEVIFATLSFGSPE